MTLARHPWQQRNTLRSPRVTLRGVPIAPSDLPVTAQTRCALIAGWSALEAFAYVMDAGVGAGLTVAVGGDWAKANGTANDAKGSAASGKPATSNIAFAPLAGTVLRLIVQSSDSFAWPSALSGRLNQGWGEFGW